MLRRLYVNNYAIISELEVEFTNGLNIITGETGAGKSILIGALGLILGNRADSSVMLDNAGKCRVEGSFHHPDHESIRQFFLKNDIDPEDEIILRREISATGKSRAFINDTPVNLSQLQELASLLVDLHQQFDTLELGSNRFQMEVMDALAGHEQLLKEYRRSFEAYSSSKKQLELLEGRKAEAMKEYDYHAFLFNELEEASFGANEIENLEAELRLLEHGEQVNAALVKIAAVLDGDEQPVSQLVKTLVNNAESVARYHPQVQAVADRLRSSLVELKDIAADADHMASAISMDPARQQLVADRISLGNRLLKKHHVKSTGELLEVQRVLGERLGNTVSLDNEISKVSAESERQLQQAIKIAATLREGRKKQVSALQKEVGSLLHRVGMPNASLKVDLHDAPLNDLGTDQVEFLFDGNKSGRFEPLRKVASGGEFSRLLLCIKTLVAGSLSLPVMIFDEIDTGISGEAAKQVGILMKELGTRHQVISITHQPQIAAKAAAHYFVFKASRDGVVRTQLKRLSDDERVMTIARMMSGEKPSDAALTSARELIGS